MIANIPAADWAWPVLFSAGIAIFGWAAKALYGEIREMRLLLTQYMERQRADHEDIQELKAIVFKLKSISIQRDSDG